MRAALTFAATMAVGVAAAAVISELGFGGAAGFCLGMAYMVGAALIINTSAAAR